MKNKSEHKKFYKRKVAEKRGSMRKIRWGCTKTVEYCCTRVENVIMSDFY